MYVMNKICKKVLRNIFKLSILLPDKIVVSMIYFVRLKRICHINHPKRFTEWIQWYKIYYRNPAMYECVDKYQVRNYLTKKGCERYLNTLYQLCEKEDDIVYDSLPTSFVIKTTDGGNGENVFICRDKSKIDREAVNNMIRGWRHRRLDVLGREWAYSGCKNSRIIVEKFIEDKNHPDKGLIDYKFLCFNGRFKYLWIDLDRYGDHKRCFFNNELQYIHVNSDHPCLNYAPELPDNMSEMITLAEKLASEFPFARVDLYNVEGKIYFGEITFYPWSGYIQFNPDSFDFELGKCFRTVVSKQ